jgi:hypothetical protein
MAPKLAEPLEPFEVPGKKLTVINRYLCKEVTQRHVVIMMSMDEARGVRVFSD